MFARGMRFAGAQFARPWIPSYRRSGETIRFIRFRPPQIAGRSRQPNSLIALLWLIVG